MVYMASADGDAMIGAPGGSMIVDLSAFSDILLLTGQPAMSAPGQRIIVQGSGYVAGDRITGISIGNQTAYVSATATSDGRHRDRCERLQR